jgi:ABC-type sulfate transport system permease component
MNKNIVGAAVVYVFLLVVFLVIGYYLIFAESPNKSIVRACVEMLTESK